MFSFIYHLIKKLNFIFNKTYSNNNNINARDKLFYKNYKKNRKCFFKKFNNFLILIDLILENRYNKIYLWLHIIFFITCPVILCIRILYGF